MTKPQKQLKRSIETEKINNRERIPIKTTKESSRSNDENATNSVNNKFQPKIKIKNAKELIQKDPTKENLSNECLKEHFKDVTSSVAAMLQIQTLRPSIYQNH